MKHWQYKNIYKLKNGMKSLFLLYLNDITLLVYEYLYVHTY